jgi:chaperone BCS1
VLFASTNFPENLDAALRRPGRFDVDLKFDFATHEQAMEIYKHFYSPTPQIIEAVNDSFPSSTSSDTEKSRINDEAEHFANVIKEADIKVSIATIQGFLSLYKREPEVVQEKVAEWAEGIRNYHRAGHC